MLVIGNGSLVEPQLSLFEFETVTVNHRGKIIEQETRQAKYYREDLGKGIFLDMVAIAGGTFLMGYQEKLQHSVSLPPFYMGKFQITQAQWFRVASFPPIHRFLNPDPSSFKGENRPVESVSWLECQEFCARLCQYTGKSYRLPSEAEWEYACRAGTVTPFHCGETLTAELANYDASYSYGEAPKGQCLYKTLPVGSFPANGWGLYDMHGNLWEWCEDRWQDNDLDNSLDCPTEGSDRAMRGGSWMIYPWGCRSAHRRSSPLYYASYGIKQEFKKNRWPRLWSWLGFKNSIPVQPESSSNTMEAKPEVRLNTIGVRVVGL